LLPGRCRRLLDVGVVDDQGGIDVAVHHPPGAGRPRRPRPSQAALGTRVSAADARHPCGGSSCTAHRASRPPGRDCRGERNHLILAESAPSATAAPARHQYIPWCIHRRSPACTRQQRGTCAGEPVWSASSRNMPIPACYTPPHDRRPRRVLRPRPTAMLFTCEMPSCQINRT
jgi:hypothetical protein